MARKFKDAHRQKRYDHYSAADIVRNIAASDRRLFWFGRYGITAKKTGAAPNMYGYPIWAAGFDLYRKHGAPDFDIKSASGATIREIFTSINTTQTEVLK